MVSFCLKSKSIILSFSSISEQAFRTAVRGGGQKTTTERCLEILISNAASLFHRFVVCPFVFIFGVF